jgi:hypothetical protein
MRYRYYHLSNSCEVESDKQFYKVDGLRNLKMNFEEFYKHGGWLQWE